MATESDPIAEEINRGLEWINGLEDEMAHAESFDKAKKIQSRLDIAKSYHSGFLRGKSLALAAIRQEVERIALEAIGKDETPPPSQCGWAMNDKCSCGHYQRNKVRATQRQRLAAALRGLEGK